MAKVFTITAGLENMGALKTGGQGSVYKGRRIGEVITAIKLLPTPIYSESAADKNYIDFQNEVQKLKRVNEEPNPHVVTILSSGITDTGNFPYIEMEYIDGPDLEELLQPPQEKIFTIKEALKVAGQLADALAHCHKMDVRHGDIKSNNVKYNKNTGNYILLDFGLSIMSDEQRRSSLRHAGAIEFMAPEQNEGQMFFETDVYSFGVVLYELLAGTVPFPLHGRGESARNAVRLSHMETLPPDLLLLRKQALEDTAWLEAKKLHEAAVPAWLLNVVYKCLEKKPANRFSNGITLSEYIALNSTLARKNEEALPAQFTGLQTENGQLIKERAQLQKRVAQYKEQLEEKEKDADELKAIIVRKDYEIKTMRQGTTAATGSGVSKNVFLLVLMLAVALGGYAVYKMVATGKVEPEKVAGVSAVNNDAVKEGEPTATPVVKRNAAEKRDTPLVKKQQQPKQTTPATQTGTTKQQEQTDDNTEKVATRVPDVEVRTEVPKADAPKRDSLKKTLPETVNNTSGSGANRGVGLYTVNDKAYFHNEPEESTRREAFINRWNNAVLAALNEKNGFIYVVYTNKDGQTSKGWLRKRDVTRINK